MSWKRRSPAANRRRRHRLEQCPWQKIWDSEDEFMPPYALHRLARAMRRARRRRTPWLTHGERLYVARVADAQRTFIARIRF